MIGWIETMQFCSQDGQRLHAAFGSRGSRDVGNFISNGTIADGSWHHVAFTYDGKIERIYINDEIDSEKQVEILPGTNTEPVRIRRNPFVGLI